MYGYTKTMRLFLAEYLMALLLHTVYAFYDKGAETGRIVLWISCVTICATALVVFLVKKEKFVVPFSYLMVLLATAVIGYFLNTLAFSIFIVSVISSCFCILLDAIYIIYMSAISSAVAIGLVVFIPEVISRNVSPFMFCVYIAIFIVLSLNLYIVVSNANKFMKGMEEKAEEARRASDSKNLFLANMSHEIRTPMNAICGMAELTLRDKTLSPEARENTENIKRAGTVLISIVNDILDYSKMESGKLEIVPVTYSFKHMVDDVMNMSSLRVEDKQVEVKAEIQPGLPDLLIGDELRIRQILFNLLSNAIKYTENGYVILEVTGEEDSGFLDLTISVTDSGIGIKKEDLNKLFVSFQQLDTRRLRTREGTGLGLAICKQLLSLMGGRIEVESTYGVGSKFTVHLSQKISTASSLKEEKSTEEKVKEPIVTVGAKVLVVDDNLVNLKVSEGLLKTFGLDVVTCVSGRECLEILSREKDFDIIFIDHMMPELDGIDTLNLIRADNSEYMKTVPLIALTANVVSGVREMFISEGFDDYVPKPIDMNWLNSILRKYIKIEKQR